MDPWIVRNHRSSQGNEPVSCAIFGIVILSRDPSIVTVRYIMPNMEKILAVIISLQNDYMGSKEVIQGIA